MKKGEKKLLFLPLSDESSGFFFIIFSLAFSLSLLFKLYKKIVSFDKVWHFGSRSNSVIRYPAHLPGCRYDSRSKKDLIQFIFYLKVHFLKLKSVCLCAYEEEYMITGAGSHFCHDYCFDESNHKSLLKATSRSYFGA